MRLRGMRRLVETDLRDLQKLLNRNPKTARAELAKIFQKSRSHRGKRSMSEFETGISAFSRAWSACSLQVVGGSLTRVATSLTKTEGFPSPGPRKVVALRNVISSSTGQVSITSARCMLFIVKALLILAKHRE
jgi:hypothetical protein